MGGGGGHYLCLACSCYWHAVQWEEINLAYGIAGRATASHQKILIKLFMVTKIFVWLPNFQKHFNHWDSELCLLISNFAMLVAEVLLYQNGRLQQWWYLCLLALIIIYLLLFLFLSPLILAVMLLPVRLLSHAKRFRPTVALHILECPYHW